MMKHYVEFKILSGECVVRELINVSTVMYNGVVYSFDYIKSLYPGSTIVPFMQKREYSKVLKTAGGKWIPIR